jgi:hypothetical protein
MTIEARGFEYSPLGGRIPQSAPSEAWKGIVNWEPAKIGKYRLNIFVCWIVSRQGVLMSWARCLTVFIPWDRIITVIPASQAGYWAINHSLQDVRSPILCTDTIARIVLERRPFTVDGTDERTRAT